MVHLRSVKIRGFKSFAKPTELLLEPGVTVIIGPNGSGKSNIADAVLWVLGEQSPGNLRGRTMQDVMFSGADGKKQSGVAEVALIFDNGSGSLPLDCSELEVTRRLTRDTGSEYRLNGSSCRLLDIQDVVGQLGLGREMHSVVSQGKVESLLNSSAEARRAMVEEAAGLGRFKKRRERAQAKLERTTQNLVRARDIEDEVRKAMRPLRQQVAAAERFTEATEDWASAKGRLLLYSLVEAQGALSAGEKELATIDSGLNDVGGRVAELRRQRAAEEEGFASALQERERLGGLFHQTRAAAEYMEARTATLRQRLARAEGDLDRARRRLELAKSDVSSSEVRLSEVMSGTADEARLERVAGWSEDLRKALDEALPAYQEAASREDDLKDDVFELESTRSRALQDRDFLRREKEERSRVEAEVAVLLRQTEERVAQLEAETSRLEAAVQEAGETVLVAKSAVLDVAREREEARDAAQEAVRSEVALAEVLAGLESRQAVLRGVLERREGLPEGARGLLETGEGYRALTELLVVEPGYERAVAAALGSVVQAVVVPEGTELSDVLVKAPGPVVARRARGRSGASKGPKAPPGTRDLWALIDGPEDVMATLRLLAPEVFVVEGEEQKSCEAHALEEIARRAGVRVVNKAGELLQDGVYVARRREVGAESLLAAANELDSAQAEYDSVMEERRRAGEVAATAATRAEEAEESLRAREEQVRLSEHEVAARNSELDLCRRRLEEAQGQLEELRDRESKERDLAAALSNELTAVETTIKAKESELEAGRTAVRELQASLESMRASVARLEEKKGQSALVEVKLRERCRTLGAERMRAENQKQAADAEMERCQRRVEFLDQYAPVISRLLGVAELLAEKGRTAVEGLRVEVESTRDRTEGTAKTMRDWGSEEIGLQREYDDMTARLTEVRIEQARLEDRRLQLEEELGELRRRHLTPRSLKPEDVAAADLESLESAVQRAERRRDRIGPINPLAEQEYGQMQERAEFLAEQRGDLEESVMQLEEVISGLDEHIERSFNEVFEAAKENFQAVIGVVFPGARGSLRLTEPKPSVRSESEDGEASAEELPEDEQNQAPRGVTLEVKFANKAPRSLSLLSGGEKAMTAIAFLFSLFLAKPCPFYILDEVEASLDDINIRRFLSLVEQYRDKTQFIIITHQRQTMEVADTLYGVALEGDGTSRVLSRKMSMAKGA